MALTNVNACLPTHLHCGTLKRALPDYNHACPCCNHILVAAYYNHLGLTKTTWGLQRLCLSLANFALPYTNYALPDYNHACPYYIHVFLGAYYNHLGLTTICDPN